MPALSADVLAKAAACGTPAAIPQGGVSKASRISAFVVSLTTSVGRIDYAAAGQATSVRRRIRLDSSSRRRNPPDGGSGIQHVTVTYRSSCEISGTVPTFMLRDFHGDNNDITHHSELHIAYLLR